MLHTKLSKAKSKGKIVPVLLSVEHHAVKAYWGSVGTSLIL